MREHHHLEVEHAVPEAPVTPRFRRSLAVIVGLAAVAAATLAFLEADAGRQKELALVDSNRQALAIFVDIAASAPRVQFEANAARSSLALSSEATARILSAPRGEAFRIALALEPAQRRAARKLSAVASEMAAIPEEGPVDEATAAAVNSEFTSLIPQLAVQNETADRADTYATRQENSVFGIGLVAIAAAMCGLAGLMGVGRPGNVALIVAGTSLTVGVLWGVWAYVF